MSKAEKTFRPQAPGSGRRALPASSKTLQTLVCALFLVLGGIGTAMAQYPNGPLTPVKSDKFDAGAHPSVSAMPANWWEFHWDPYGDDGDWEVRGEVNINGDIEGPCPGNLNRWTAGGSYYIREDDSDLNGGDGQSFIVPDKAYPEDPSFVGVDLLTNIRMEFDFYADDDYDNRIGAVWNVTIGAVAWDEGVAEDAYLFYIRDMPEDNAPGNKASWDLIKRINGVDIPLASGEDPGFELIDASGDPTWPAGFESVFEEKCYRLRVDYSCGTIRVQVKTFNCDPGCVESNWHTIVEYFDTAPLPAPGMAGMFSGSPDGSEPENYYDNFDLWSWGLSCGGCSEWTTYQEVNRDSLEFKLLYDAALIDFSAGRQITDPPDDRLVKGRRIDVDTREPSFISAYNTSAIPQNPYCNGWRLLVDLPAPGFVSDLTSIEAYLEPAATAVEASFDPVTGNLIGWVPDFDNDPLSLTFNPIPMTADGTTPINASLLDAFDWYVAQRSPGGDYFEDTEAACRKWYVVLITDGDESCENNPPNDDLACEAGQAASKFARPDLYGGYPEEWKVPIYTIGFSDSLAADSPLTCLADDTGGKFLTATNASELKTALYDVFDNLSEEKRSFIPFRVSPPPSSAAGPASVQDFLALYPFFSARDAASLWDGDLFAFRFNRDNPTLPVTGDCELDVSQELWGGGAKARLAAQIAAHTIGNPQRFVFMGSDHTGSLLRYDLKDMPTNSGLLTEFHNLLNVIGGVTDVRAQEVVNFLRGIYMDNDISASPDPEQDARPDGWSALGDIWHSQPVIINPPNDSMFVFNYGFSADGEAGAHNYPTFMTEQAKRRRVALAGANDGMLHAFDAGFWDRDDGGTYNDAHDLGTGNELFAWVPHAVMDRLDRMTPGLKTGKRQQYMVDGSIATADVFIDSDGNSVREWRTVAIATMRKGGRGMVALDVTQPDPTDSSDAYKPTESVFPGCLDGSDPTCTGEYPRVMWEFEDKTDADTAGNFGFCPGGDCTDFWDLGWTWSKPAIARIAVYPGTDDLPDDIFVAFFGGGWDKFDLDKTGNFLYGVNIETGEIIYKLNTVFSVPGAPTALDYDIDGFHDRIYVGDSNGGVWRIEFPRPSDADWATTGVATVLHSLPGAATIPEPSFEGKIFDFIADFVDDRQRFFTRPITVPVLFNGSTFTWAVALGTGDRANLPDKEGSIDHFFFLVDGGQTTPLGASNLVAVDFTDLDPDFECTVNALDPTNGRYGWYLSLRPNEKVVFDATVINGHVLFPTFDPTPSGAASHNVPDQCGSPPPVVDPSEFACTASGIGRFYDLWFQCGLGDYGEMNDIITGSEDYTIGGNTYIAFTGSTFGKGHTEEFPNVKGHLVTNWRQE